MGFILRSVQVVVFIAIMGGITYGLRWLVAAHEQFGLGFCAGMGTMLLALWGVHKLDPDAFKDRSDR